MRRAHTPRSPPEPRARVLQVAGKAGEPPTRNVPRAPDSANASTPAQPACMSVQAGFTTPVQTRIRTQACARCADRSPATALATSRMHCRRRRSTILAITINRVLFLFPSLAHQSQCQKSTSLDKVNCDRHCERGMGVAMRVGVLCSLMAVTRAFGVVARTGGVSAMRRPRPLATGTRALVASSSPRRSPRKSSPAPGAPAPEAAPSNSARAERPAPPSLLGSHLRHIMVADDFLEPVLADAMRKTFDDRFREPRTTLSERFVWVR